MDEELNGGELSEELEINLESEGAETEEVEAQAEGEAEGAAEEQGVEAQQAQKSRAQARIERQQAELKSAREAAEEASRRSAELERQMQELQAAQARAREQEQMQYMSPEEKAAFETKLQLGQMQRQFQQLQFETQDAADRSAFSAKAVTNPMYSKYADQVEAELGKMRARGQTAPREAVLAYLVGQEVIRKGPSAAARQRNAGAQRVANAQGKSPAGKGNAARQAPGTGDSLEDLEARLKDAVF
ncbi:MAG: hypothetical protein KGL63_06630 [Betaproteobacteria bacterium]|nr:hypothetical protein [Betaproteobacteria bacterium]